MLRMSRVLVWVITLRWKMGLLLTGQAVYASSAFHIFPSTTPSP